MYWNLAAEGNALRVPGPRSTEIYGSATRPGREGRNPSTERGSSMSRTMMATVLALAMLLLHRRCGPSARGKAPRR